ncbi:MAG TPA: hypothetical protein VLA71_12210 [Algoriphagus sp.]|nr:hypothetical protein [Algoriphagus sp.]
MSISENPYKLYPNLGYWFMLFIPLTVAGFFFTYFTKLQMNPSLTHLHFALMATWMGIVITQPLLIHYRKTHLHRKVGKLSYVVVPLVILSTYLVMRQGYANQLAAFESDFAEGVAPYTYEEGRMNIASFTALPFVYLLWLTLFYGLAIGFRKLASFHARFMIAAVLTFMGPTVDRILFFGFDIATIGNGIPTETVSFVLIDLILGFLLIQDLRKGKNPWPFGLALGLYILVQIFYFTFTKTTSWQQFVNFMLY